MLDKHIDRSDVKALQGVQLTDTNFLIDFIHFEDLSSKTMRICNLKTTRISFSFLNKDLKNINDLVAIARRSHPIPFRTRT